MEVFAKARLMALAAEAHNVNIPEDSLLGQVLQEAGGTDANEVLDPIRK